LILSCVCSTTDNDPSVRRGDANQLRDRYQMIVEQITSMQRDGVLSGTVSDWHIMSRRQSDSQTDSRDESQVDEPAAATTSDGEVLFIASRMGWFSVN